MAYFAITSDYGTIKTWETDFEITDDAFSLPVMKERISLDVPSGKYSLIAYMDGASPLGNKLDFFVSDEKDIKLEADEITEFNSESGTLLNQTIARAENVEIDEGRIAQEVAIISDKASVDEEIIRLRSHLNQMRITFNEGGQIGRKLDFIIQEMNREANTIASKSSDMDMTNYVINIKNLIEKIREQVQNIE